MLTAGLAGCALTSHPIAPATSAPPVQPAPTGNEFSAWGFTWAMHGTGAPGGGSFSAANVDVQANEVVLTLNEDGEGGSVGAEIATLTPLGYGTYTFTFYQNVIHSGSVASGFVYLPNSATEIDTEQQGCFPDRWNFTNYTKTDKEQASFVDGYDPTKPHTLEYVWTANKITWSIDGEVVATHTENIPSTPAPFLFNFWGTNSSNWGGMATPGMRQMVITGFSYAGE
jgi:beta-glucanase (GH16 family)